MTKGNTIPAAAPSADRSIAYYLAAARRQHDELAAKFTAAEREYHEAVNALPIPELMQGPVVLVTDLDSLEKAETVLRMGTRSEEEIARLLDELKTYRERRDIIAAQLALDRLGEQLAAAARWRVAFNAYEEAAAPLRVKGLSDSQIDSLADPEGEAIVNLYRVPAPNLGAVAAKLLVLNLTGFSEAVAYPAILADVERLGELDQAASGIASAVYHRIFVVALPLFTLAEEGR